MHILLTQTLNPDTNTLDFHLHFFVMLDENTTKAMMILDFTEESGCGDPWLEARTVLDTLKTSPSIESARDNTGQHKNHGYSAQKGVDV